MITFRNNTASTVGAIRSSGHATANLTSSDYRLKENETAITDGITRLKTLKPYKFNFKNDNTSTKVDGFFAHEVSSAVPESISHKKDELDEDSAMLVEGQPDMEEQEKEKDFREYMSRPEIMADEDREFDDDFSSKYASEDLDSVGWFSVLKRNK